ncbi:hypothetical protein [Kitasatospora sp. HPMI-4]|uniref:hypothetical protein n=1 Tax=Kitasatospora sp. HPMI-4 TaxID=3448443 RepID=UPI003F1BB70A
MKHLSLRGSAIAVGLITGLAAAPGVAFAAQATTVACGDTAGLIAAINTLDAGTGGTIELAKDCTYAFGNAIDGSDDALPAISGKITITGWDTRIVRSTLAGTRFRLFEVLTSGELTLCGIKVSTGSTGLGGGIFNAGKLTLKESQVTGNTADDNGGGVYNTGGTVTLVHSSVSGNTATNGAGIYNQLNGTVTVKNSKINGNQADSNGGGIHNASGTVTAEDSTFEHNTARDDFGGAISNSDRVTLRETVISDNTAGLDGGGIINRTFNTLEITGGRIDHNTAGRDGGGISNAGTATLTETRVDENSAGRDGGGINNQTNPGTSATLTLHHSAVTENTAARDGGGINNQAGSTVTLDDTVVVRNRPDNCFPLNSIPGCRN